MLTALLNLSAVCTLNLLLFLCRFTHSFYFTVVKNTDDSENPTISVSNETDGLCAVRVTKMSDGSTQYQSNVNPLGDLVNRKNAFTFNIEVSANYMVEAWSYNSDTKKLIPTAVKFI